MKLFLFAAKGQRFLVHAKSKKDATDLFRQKGLVTLGGKTFENEAKVTQIKDAGVLHIG